MSIQSEFTISTEQDFEIFKSECKKWISYFSLNNFHYFYQHQNSKNDKEHLILAYCLFPDDFTNRNFTLGLSKHIANNAYSEEEIRRAAFHEVCESLLFRIGMMARSRYCLREDIDDEIHNLVRLFENTVFEYEQRKIKEFHVDDFVGKLSTSEFIRKEQLKRI